MAKVILQFLLLSCLLLSNAWADLFCPNNFNSINLGDTLNSVLQACGKPDSQKVTKKMPFEPQEWTYYVQSYPGMPGTLKTTVAFDQKGKVINISVNGAGLSQTQICNNQTNIQFGDTTDQVEAVCGKPAVITKTNAAMGAPKEIVETDLIYQGTPPVTLVFEDGILKERK
jgi:hypothetical protein